MLGMFRGVQSLMGFWDTYADGTPMTPLPKGSLGGGLGHCDKCDKPRMTYVTCYADLVTLCDKHKQEAPI
jgi:hypothetical protein